MALDDNTTAEHFNSSDKEVLTVRLPDMNTLQLAKEVLDYTERGTSS